MNDAACKKLNAELGYEFHLFSLEHPEWMAANIPPEATVILQTDDPGYNAWAVRIARDSRKHDRAPSPTVLVHVREIRPPQSRLVRLEAEVVTS